MLIIGIDPDTDKSGVAVVVDGKIVDLMTSSLIEFRVLIPEWVRMGAHFALESIEETKPTFNRGVNTKANTRISQNVGAVKQQAKNIRLELEHYGAQYTLIKPLTGTAKTCKKNAEFFNKYTGWHKKSNADQRDAAMLALNLHSRLKRGGRG